MVKKKWVALLISALGIALVLGALERASANRLVTGTSFVMDTVVQYSFYGKHAQAARDMVAQELSSIESRMSMHLEDSEISELNRNAGKNAVQLSEDTYELLSRSVAYAEQTSGIFDVTIAPLASAWGITSDHPQVPEQSRIDALLALVGYQDVQLDPDSASVRLAREGQAVDVGGIAKGYACDVARRIAQECGVKSGYLSIGGNIMVIGEKPDKTPFKFGIRDPRGTPNQYFGVVTIPDLTIATSGDYERFFEQGGVRYHHILDPRTGYPAQEGLMSVSVISPDGAYADFMSTWLFIMGREFVVENLNNFDCGLVAVDLENRVYVSENLKDRFFPADQTGVYQFEGTP